MRIAIAQVLNAHTASVNALDFSKDGELLLSTGDDGRITLTSAATATQMRVAKAAAGASFGRFTHDPLSILLASPTDYVIRYMSLHDNRYLRSFRGHTDKVVALEMSPKEDFFASASLDGAARIWDARTTTCQVGNLSQSLPVSPPHRDSLTRSSHHPPPLISSSSYPPPLTSSSSHSAPLTRLLLTGHHAL